METQRLNEKERNLVNELTKVLANDPISKAQKVFIKLKETGAKGTDFAS